MQVSLHRRELAGSGIVWCARRTGRRSGAQHVTLRLRTPAQSLNHTPDGRDARNGPGPRRRDATSSRPSHSSRLAMDPRRGNRARPDRARPAASSRHDAARDRPHDRRLRDPRGVPSRHERRVDQRVAATALVLVGGFALLIGQAPNSPLRRGQVAFPKPFYGEVFGTGDDAAQDLYTVISELDEVVLRAATSGCTHADVGRSRLVGERVSRHDAIWMEYVHGARISGP